LEKLMAMSRRFLVGAGLTLAFGALAVGQAVLRADASQTVQAPRFEVDPMWPKPLPNHQILGSVIGVAVDSRDHVFIIHRGDSTLNARTERGADANPPLGECCRAAPPVLEFDPAGNLVKAWGGPAEGYEWPTSNHGIAVDHLDNIWIGGNGSADSHILKFTHDGKFIMSVGTPKQTGGASNDSTRFGRVAKITFDSKANEAYLADGYLNRRVAVIDMTTGKMKRFWGAYGEKPSDADLGRFNPDQPLIRQFRNPAHCADPSVDGLIYVCDRVNNRIQVFQKNGTFVKEQQIAPRTLGDGAVWDVAFSRDPEQRWMYLADGRNEKIWVLDRKSLSVVTTFGDGGRQPGQFFAVHSIVTDSKGNIYTTETYEGKRLQKFVYKGVGPVPRNQGTVWPAK
jgi:DNA-binding beta-propeller fold protein YncE